MKKLYCAMLLLLAFATQAQTITEENLLGTWQLTKMADAGDEVNVETQTVTLSPDKLSFMEEHGQNPEDEKKEMLQMASTIKMTVGPGNVITFALNGNEQQSTYTIAQKDGATVIAITGKGTLTASITNGCLRLESPNGKKALEFKKAT
jgi:hypothetical protein